MRAEPEGAGAPAAVVAPAPVPLTILTGFLGAGKTTLLNRLLNGDHGLQIAVLVNDFGSVNIDAELVVGVQDDMISLANGCVCCEIRDDLIGAVDGLVTSDDPPEHIVLEASGVADPASIWATFAGSQHPEWLRLDGVVCVVDAEQIFDHIDEAPGLFMLKTRQIGFADLVVLNKVDLAGPEMVAWVRQWIDTMMDRVRVIEANFAEVPLDVLLGADRRTEISAGGADAPSGDHLDGHDAAHASDAVDHDTANHDTANHDTANHDTANHDTANHDHGDHAHGEHRDQFRTWTFETGRPFDRASLQEMIRVELPGTVYRCKGFVTVDGDPPERMLLQAVGRRSELTPYGDVPGGSGVAMSRIVAIGASGWDESGLQAAFERCLVS